MLEFIANKEDFQQRAKLILTAAGNRLRGEFVELIANNGCLGFTRPDSDTSMDAVIITPGHARVPLITFKGVVSQLPSYSHEAVRIAVENGKIKLEKSSTSHPDIELLDTGGRTINLPADVPPGDVLALLHIYSPEEIAANGLTNRVLRARKAATRAIEIASTKLAHFGITADDIKVLLEESTQRRAALLQRNFKASAGE